MSEQRRVLVTGATGFLGRAVTARLLAAGHAVRGSTRGSPVAGRAASAGLELVTTGPLGSDTDWAAALDGIDAVIHLAARAHVLGDDPRTADAEFRRANVDGTAALARAAAAADVGHFVFASSIGAIAGASERPLAEDAPARPVTPYGRSKLAAEHALTEALDGRVPVAVLRLPLVFGADAPGNLRLLAAALRRGVPLPLASVRNRRSYLFAQDLAETVSRLVAARTAGTFHVAFAEPVSTPDLVRAVAAALGRRARLFPCPPALVRTAAGLVGREAAARGLTESLVLDTRRLQATLGWAPPTDLAAGMNTAFVPLNGRAAASDLEHS